MLDIDWYYIISCQKQANLLINPIITISHLICHLFTILISFTLDLIHFFRKKSSYDTSNHLRKRESQAWNCKPLLLIKINSVCGATGDSHKIENFVNITMMRVRTVYDGKTTLSSMRRTLNYQAISFNLPFSLFLLFPFFLPFYPWEPASRISRMADRY